MKIKILALIIGISTYSFAQNPMLFENPWVLQDLVINSESHLPPSNSEVSFVTLTFDFYEFESIEYFSGYGTICESIGGPIDFNEINNSFSFLELNETLGGGCFQTPNFIYEDTYFSFFYDNFDNGNLFDYSIIINTDNSKTLIITSINGDQAIYGSEVLSIENNTKPTLSLFYNAKNNSIEIDSKDYLERFSIKMFNTLGKQILNLKKYNKEKRTIDLQNFPDGIYFVFLQNEIGEILKKTIIKH